MDYIGSSSLIHYSTHLFKPFKCYLLDAISFINISFILGGYTIPAGTSVGLLFYGMHHNPRVYPDPDHFKPERFLPENSAGRHPYAFVPFSAGPRNCIGQKYGMLEVKVVLANLLRHFRFSVNESTPELQTPSSEIVLKPPNGMNLVVSLRT